MGSKFLTGAFPQVRKRYRQDTIELLTGICAILKVSTHFFNVDCRCLWLILVPG